MISVDLYNIKIYFKKILIKDLRIDIMSIVRNLVKIQNKSFLVGLILA